MVEEAERGREDEHMLSVTKVEVNPDNQDETKIEEIVGKMPTSSADRVREAMIELVEEEEKLAMDFEYVPLKLIYHQLATQKANNTHFYGSWPFKKEYIPNGKAT